MMLITEEGNMEGVVKYTFRDVSFHFRGVVGAGD